jgi:DNA repair protein SbcD/Mre11
MTTARGDRQLRREAYMLSRPFRFLQASDFHLEQPCYGLTEVPDHLAELLADALYRAATRVFDLAISEAVDFVLLAGNLVHPNRAGPRGLAFLREQFARLAERGIVVYWAAGETDCRHQWPPSIDWPRNVHIFPGHRVERLIHSGDGQPVCQIAGLSLDETTANGAGESPAVFLDEFAAGAVEQLTIAVVPRELEPAALTAHPVRYWALGGGSNFATPLALSNPQRAAHVAGSPQGRCPAQIGPHGCTLVKVDEALQFQLVPLASDVVRWHQERIVVAAVTSRDELGHLFHERLKSLMAAAPDRTLLIHWTISGEGPLLSEARQTALATELTSSLRVEYGFRTPAAWSLSIEVEPPALPEAWFEQETLLGEFLRTVRSQEISGAEPLDLRPYLSEKQRAEAGAGWATIAEPAVRSSILRQAALLGSELLRPDDAGAKELAR